MKQLKFRSHLVDKIKNGAKTTTWRLFDEQGLQAGDKVECIMTEGGEKFADIEILTCIEKPVKDLTSEDIHTNNYSDRDQALLVLKKYYPHPITDGTVVKIITFKHLGAL